VFTKKEDSHGYIHYSLAVVALWGLVPCLAKLGNLPGGLTTMYVNWFGLAGVLVIMLVNGSIKELARPQAYKRLVGIAMVWPLTYSVLYFGSIEKGSASLTTIANYLWPVFYLGIAFFLARKKFQGWSWLVVSLGVAGVIVPTLLADRVSLILFPLMLGIGAALCQAFFSFASEKAKENDWLITFINHLVTAVGSTIYVLLFERMVVPDLQTLGYLAYMGILAGSFGFWAFLKASKDVPTPEAKTASLTLMCLTPLVQVFTLSILRAEAVSNAKWIGVFLMASAFALFRYYSGKERLKAPQEL
jgi:drug/metabolite transporter (DMT)-like permease